MISGTRPRGPRKNEPAATTIAEAHAPQVTRIRRCPSNAAGADDAHITDAGKDRDDAEHEQRRCVRASAHEHG